MLPTTEDREDLASAHRAAQEEEVVQLLHEQQQIVVTPDADSWMDGGIVQHLGFQLGGQKYFWDVVEAVISDDFIIGIDFLKSVKCKIDLESNVLELGNGHRVQATMKQKWRWSGDEAESGVIAQENFSSAKDYEVR